MNIDYDLVREVSNEVIKERYRQNMKWGLQRHNDGDWLMILVEEVGELAQAMQVSKGWGKSSDAQNKYIEAIHVSAVAAAIAEQALEELRKIKKFGVSYGNDTIKEREEEN